MFKVKRVLNSSDGIKISEISTKFGFKGLRHIINFSTNSSSTELKLKGGLLKNYYDCNYLGNKYTIIKHHGHKTSIFKNNIQIGFYEKSKFKKLNSQKINLICNADINQGLIYSFILALELSYENHDEIVSVDLGNFTKEYKKFNPKWTPLN